MSEQLEPIVDRGGLTVLPATGSGRLARIADLLDRAEDATGSPLVDESERDRLERALQAFGGPGTEPVWLPALAWRGEQPVGYAAVLVDREAGEATGDVAVLPAVGTGGSVGGGGPAGGERASVLGVLLEAAARLAAQQGARRLQVWTRRAGQREVDVAGEAGFEVVRRLGVLGRGLDGSLPPTPSSTAHVRAYRPADEDGVVEVLAAAYTGTAEAGWDHHRFRERTRLSWFRTEDLLVAELPVGASGPPLAGLHWLKRRDEHTGEVYNLAVHPQAQGHGVGPRLLHAGLAHLQAQGCREVILWVDLANERAVRLYTAAGFETRWQDLALGRSLPG